MMLPRYRTAHRILVVACISAGITGCSHYYLPANSFLSPETSGPDRIGRLELAAIQTGADLLAPAQPQSADPETGKVPDPALQSAPGYLFGASLAVKPDLEVGIRFEPYAPSVLHAKYQIYGEPESKAAAGNWSAALAGAGGFLLGRYGSETAMLYTTQASVIGGWRFADRHLLSLAPFFSFSGISGVGTASGSGMRYGGSFGYQYDIESLIFRAELTWALGSQSQASGTVNPGGFFPGALLGFKL